MLDRSPRPDPFQFSELLLIPGGRALSSREGGQYFWLSSLQPDLACLRIFFSSLKKQKLDPD